MFGRTTHAFVFSSDLVRQEAVGEAMRQSHFEVLSFSEEGSLIMAVERLAAEGDVAVLDATELVGSLIDPLDAVQRVSVAGAIVGANLPRRWAPSADAGLFWLLSYIKSAPGHPRVGLYLRPDDRRRELADSSAEPDAVVVPVAPVAVAPVAGQPVEATADWLAPLSRRLNDGLLPDYESVDIEWTGETLVLTGQVLTRTRKHRAEQMVRDTGTHQHVLNHLDVI